MKKILVIGKLGYHEETIVQPILNELSVQYHIDRYGESLDFFIPSEYDNMHENYINSIINFKKIKDYDALLFVDHWNPLVPLYQMAAHCYNKKIKFIGIVLGSYHLPGDVVCPIRGSKEYEDYINSFYDFLITPGEFLIDLMGTRKNAIRSCRYIIEASQVKTPEFKFKRRVVNAHRYDYDKGFDRFEEFVIYCSEHSNVPIEFIVIGNASTEQLERMKNLGIIHLGYLNLNEQAKLASEGGYAWSSARSETVGYALWRLVSLGLTPLINSHKAYDCFHPRFKYNINDSFSDKHIWKTALSIIDNKFIMSEDDWKILKESQKDNGKIIVDCFNKIIG